MPCFIIWELYLGFSDKLQIPHSVNSRQYSIYNVNIYVVHECFWRVVVDGVGGKQSCTTEPASNMSQRQTSIISDTRTVMQGLDTLRNEHKQVSTYWLLQWEKAFWRLDNAFFVFDVFWMVYLLFMCGLDSNISKGIWSKLNCKKTWCVL